MKTVRELAAMARAYPCTPIPPSTELYRSTERLLAELGDAEWVRLDQVVSRALVAKAFEVLNAGPGSAGIGRTLALLREALVAA